MNNFLENAVELLEILECCLCYSDVNNRFKNNLSRISIVTHRRFSNNSKYFYDRGA